MRARNPNAHRCHWCGKNSGAAPFCGVCYGVMDGSVKARITASLRAGSPRLGLAIGVECLTGLAKSGVPLPPRRERERSAT